MQLEVLRFSSGAEATLGCLFEVTNRRQFLCFTLEDEFREVKVPGETRIPAGTYRVTLRTEGGKHAQYQQRYGPMHKGMLWVRDVPNYDFILIHTGNKDEHTDGCLLVGDNCDQNITDEGMVGASRNAYRRIYPPIAAALERGEEVTITYIDYDMEQAMV
jgi:hypothetical protein